MASSSPSASSMMNRPTRPPPAYELSFGVEAKLGHGEVIYVCGSCPSLGAKDPSRALRLVTDSSSYPVWSSDPVPVPLDKKVTYRYCVVAGGKLKRWEDISVDRWVVVLVSFGGGVMLVAVFSAFVPDVCRPCPLGHNSWSFWC